MVLGGHSWYAEARVTSLVVWTESSSLWILLLSRWDLLLCENSCHVVAHKLAFAAFVCGVSWLGEMVIRRHCAFRNKLAGEEGHLGLSLEVGRA